MSLPSSMASEGPLRAQLPPGFRFHPTDEELVVHYLEKKASQTPLPIAIIAEVDLYKFDPWELPEKARSMGGEQDEWYFFSPRERKYPNGARPNRAATSGHWKATGTDKVIFSSSGRKAGLKKALVFYAGKPPRGVKTSWIMHEYRLARNSLGMDEWVLCRIFKKTHKAADGGEEGFAMKRSFGTGGESFPEGLLMAEEQGSPEIQRPWAAVPLFEEDPFTRG